MLRWELEDAGGDATVLRFSCSVELPDGAITRTAAGWHMHLDALESVLDGDSVDLVDPEPLWIPIHERYVARDV